MTQIFPIKQDPACLLKWGWSNIYFDQGTTSSCHRTKKFAIDPNDFESFHNIPDKIRDRENMLAGRWCGNGCEYCQRVEEKGFVSDRMMQLSLQQDPELTPPELHTDPTSTHVTPTIVEVWFENICNMKCVYCSQIYSSQWEDENRKYGEIASIQSSSKDSFQKLSQSTSVMMQNAFWKYLDDNDRYRVLRRFHVLGGEPFLLPGLDHSIDFWEAHPNPDLVFGVISNLNIPHKQMLKYFTKFENLVQNNKVWKVQITASLDCWGPQQEYVRHGLDLDLWTKNFETLLQQSWATVSINSTLSALTIKTMPVLLRMINQWNQNRIEPIAHSFNYTTGKDSPMIFGKDQFDQDFEEILSLMLEDTEVQREQKKHMQGIAQSISNSTRQPQKILDLKSYLNELDRRRNTEWRHLFPWLAQDLSV